MNILATALFAVAVLGWIVYRQITERPVKDNPMKIVVILGVIGLVTTADYLTSAPHIAVGSVVAVLLGFVVAAGIAVPRAHSVRLRRTAEGVMVRKGGALTVVLWIAAIAAHVAISMCVPLLFGEAMPHGMDGLDNATLLLYLAISLGVQGLMMARRASERQPVHGDFHTAR
ncbi:MAG: hypothetical protein QM673_15335 [Gordonia sp. (in: high G+C Gram-positive bacteria)]